MVLSNYTRGIVERLNNENLHNENNPFVIVLDGTVGEYLENRDNHFLDSFIIIADGDYLDLHGNIFGLKRKENEDDDTFRQRILTDARLIERTTDFEKLDCQLWVYKEGVTDNNTLTSRNTYLKDLHDEDYVYLGTGTDSEYIQSKFLVEDILWV